MLSFLFPHFLFLHSFHALCIEYPLTGVLATLKRCFTIEVWYIKEVTRNTILLKRNRTPLYSYTLYIGSIYLFTTTILPHTFTLLPRFFYALYSIGVWFWWCKKCMVSGGWRTDVWRRQEWRRATRKAYI